ncbi:nicotinamide-nucleotide amidase [Vibrio sp. T187]|uniref:nicotinamide-nucleotide amidase n=1 Tax=Vibrio TaxID=662 RepID=UPI0010CA1A2E|nr:MULTISPECIES: nicotinamide-nucleotide amidase [Vibrio]MBW3694116.1 nicotinamide-nucleotide amidase [Vibrio sp. T187]
MESCQELSLKLGLLLEKKHQIMTTAESCTGGGIAAAITDIAGSSAWFDRAFITYSNEAKQEMIDVQLETLEEHGAVSEAVVEEMICGAIANSNASIGVSVSGIAGPGGGTEAKPVGTVCFAWADKRGWKKVETCHFNGDRSQVRHQATLHALQVIYDYLS